MSNYQYWTYFVTVTMESAATVLPQQLSLSSHSKQQGFIAFSSHLNTFVFISGGSFSTEYCFVDIIYKLTLLDNTYSLAQCIYVCKEPQTIWVYWIKCWHSVLCVLGEDNHGPTLVLTHKTEGLVMHHHHLDLSTSHRGQLCQNNDSAILHKRKKEWQWLIQRDLWRIQIQ